MVDGHVDGIEIIGMSSCFQHGRCLRETGPASKHLGIRLDVRSQFNGCHLMSLNGLGFQIVKGKDLFAVSIQLFDKGFINLSNIASVGLFGDMLSWMHKGITRSIIETAIDLFPSFLQVLGISIRNNLFKILVHFLLHLFKIFLVFKILPVTNQELNLLKWLDILSAIMHLIRFHSQTSILGKERKLLQIIFLDSLFHIVNLVTTQECTHSKNGSRQRHGGLIIKHSL
mmetsp:Transcript_18041/g.44585  ORF Transcript_18041/g.44585 Transcript_18041/m.44585 type:complete len:228 (-) Transcript_18041:684-1367(-)